MSRRTIFSSLLMLVFVGNMVFLTFTPRKASAEGPLKATGIVFTGCFAGGVAGNLYANSQLKKDIDRAIDVWKKNATKWIKDHLPGFLKKYLGLVGGAGIGTTVPVNDDAVTEAVQDSLGAWTKKNTRDDIIARCMARAMMIGITENTLSVVRSGGRDGGPTYIKNWVNFQTSAEYRGENIVRAQLSTARLCDYLADDVKRSFGVDPKIKTPITGQNTRTGSLQPFNLATRCTLPEGFSMENYEKDFAGNGGWDTFARLLEPQNNISGLINITQDEMQKQRSLAVNADVNQVIAEGGHLGVSGNGKADSCMVKSPIGDCLIYKDIKTPGSYIAQNVGATVTAEFAWLTSAQALDSIVAFGTEVLLNRLLDFGNPDDGDYRWANDGDPENTPAPTPTPTPTPTITPTPTPPIGPEPESLLSDLKAERDKYKQFTSLIALCPNGTSLQPETCPIGAMLNAVAWKNRDKGWGLSGKSGGHRCPSPAGIIACDILQISPSLLMFDVFGDSGAETEPRWDALYGPPADPVKRPWVAPVQP